MKLRIFIKKKLFDFQYAEDLESGFTSDVESKYKKIYEDDINPFAAFSKKVAILEFLWSTLFCHCSAHSHKHNMVLKAC